jgi:hypothetical protein
MTRAKEIEITHPFLPMNRSRKKMNKKVMRMNPNCLKKARFSSFPSLPRRVFLRIS